MNPSIKILVLCTGNGCRRQMTHGFPQSFGSELFVYSAETKRGGQVNPRAIEVMQEAGMDISHHTSDRIEPYINDPRDDVITVCSRTNESYCVTGKIKNRLHIGYHPPIVSVTPELYIRVYQGNNDKRNYVHIKNEKMRTLILTLFGSLMLFSCGGGNQQKTAEKTDDSTVYVYYFHGKQRCKTCLAVENVTKQTMAEAYSGNDKVKYEEIRTDEKENEALVEKYEITWNALIIAKADNHIDITNDAFATAVNSPDILTEQIKSEVNNFLE